MNTSARPQLPIITFMICSILLGMTTQCLAESSLFEQRYPWIEHWTDDMPPLAPLDQMFNPPNGFERIEIDETSFGYWLRQLPVRMDRTNVLLSLIHI